MINTRKHAEGTEYSGRDGRAVRDARRRLIARGVAVSLIGYDSNRDAYVFDAYTNH
jgi:hypothetical protein